MTTTLSALTTEFVRYRVKATTTGQVYNPTGDVVEFAFPASGASPAAWLPGEWEYGADHVARILVGPAGGVALTAATYDVWLKITDNPEVPVRLVGTLTIT